MEDKRLTTGADALCEFLVRQDVEYVFGLCGHTNVAVLAALERSPIRFVGVHHEQMASHAADGYTRASGKVGVVLTHLGPGLTNALTGVANATLDAVPMVVISGNVQSYFFGRHAHMESTLHADADQADAFRPFCKRVWQVQRPEALVGVLDAAFRVAQSGLPGPVLVDVAMDVFSASVEVPAELDPTPIPSPPGLDDEVAERIADLLQAAERPVLYVGGGVAAGGPAAWEAVRALAEQADAPVAYSLMGKGAMPDDHPLNMGMSGLWGTPAANAACSQADLLVAIGTRFGELDTSSWRDGTTFSIPPTRLVHVHVDPNEIGRSYVPEIGAVADSGLALRSILKAFEGRSRKVPPVPEYEEQKRTFAAEIETVQAAEQFPLHPARVLAEVNEALPENAIVVGDTGWNKNGIAQQTAIADPGALIVPGGYATMGFGPAAALGTALSDTDRAVVALVGDGAFLTNISVVVTAVEERIPVVWAVMNNGTYATISGMSRRHFASEYGASFDSSAFDYAAFARSVGAAGERVEGVGQLREMLAAAIASRVPFVLDIPCSADAVPVTGIWDINDLFAEASAQPAVQR